jgi:DNA-binding CsgD family transcriptional regulator
MSSAMRKLGCRGRVELIALAGAASGSAACLDVSALDERLGVIATTSTPAPAVARGLSPAERAVAQLAARGATNAAIARSRGTSPNTVANQQRRVFDKLGVESRAQLARAWAGRP